jgi:hypothetical protein
MHVLDQVFAFLCAFAPLRRICAWLPLRYCQRPQPDAEAQRRKGAKLGAEHLARLSAANPRQEAYPYTFWNDFVRRELIFGAEVDSLEMRRPTGGVGSNALCGEHCAVLRCV